jgi:hypothetical protein
MYWRTMLMGAPSQEGRTGRPEHEAAGSSLDKVASATVILLNEEDFAGMNEEWVKWFPTDRRHAKGRNCRFGCRV